MRFPLHARRAGQTLGVALGWLLCPAATHAQLHPTEITAAQSVQAPYRDSGRLRVKHGSDGYFGTATLIRRYTGLTAGHLLYDPDTGFSTDVRYEPALYGEPALTTVPVGYFATVSGYQAMADVDVDSDRAFNLDMGYVLFTQPAANEEWAAWESRQTDLQGSGPYLALGYAGESFAGDMLAAVLHHQAYDQILRPALYESTAYYTEGGMSGGPLYVTVNNTPTVAAVNVAGTSPPQRAFSDARAISGAEVKLLRLAEYGQGLVTGGIIKGPATAARGSTVVYKTGVAFADGKREHYELAVKYDDFTLLPNRKNEDSVTVKEIKPGKFAVSFNQYLPVGTKVKLHLYSVFDVPQGAKIWQTLTVTVQ